MSLVLRRFGGSFVFAVLALAGAFAVGYLPGRSLPEGFAALFAAVILGVLETSLSFDNAVVNARILAGMDIFWRRMFLTVGMIVAVFGMRILFPLVIVWAVGGRSFPDVAALTWRDPGEFQRILVAQHVKVAGFGGAFLWMVFFRFFMDKGKELHWLGWIERGLGKVGRMESLWIASTMVVVFLFRAFVPSCEMAAFLESAMAGILTYLLVEGLGDLLGQGQGTAKTVAAGFSTFLYLEVLDASFSFDGVVGAFAITNNLLVIALGLGIGAMFVRSLTIVMVDSGTLARFAYLEHGAFWAIGALALVLFVSATGTHVPEVVSGSVGLVLILASLFSSRSRKT
jgi:hypothetical protein